MWVREESRSRPNDLSSFKVYFSFFLVRIDTIVELWFRGGDRGEDEEKNLAEAHQKPNDVIADNTTTSFGYKPLNYVKISRFGPNVYCRSVLAKQQDRKRIV